MQDAESVVKVGDVVAWHDVPDGALVRPNSDARVYSMRINGGGRYVCNPRGVWRGFMDFPGTPWGWDPRLDEDPKRTPALIVALGLTGSESADDLRRLAEVYEVRESLATVFDKSKSPPGFEIRDRSYDDYDFDGERVGAYLGRVERWSWDDSEICDDFKTPEEALIDAWREVAERLHAAGWRPGMTAEDAARMLAAHDAAT